MRELRILWEIVSNGRGSQVRVEMLVGWERTWDWAAGSQGEGKMDQKCLSAQRNSEKGNNRCGTVPHGDMINQCDQMKRMLGQSKNEGHVTGSQEELCGASENSSV